MFKLVVFAIIFVLTGGAWFYSIFKERKILVVLAIIVSLTSSYYLLRDVERDFVGPRNQGSEEISSKVCTFKAVLKGGAARLGVVYSMGFGDTLKATGTIDKLSKARKAEATVHFIISNQMLYFWNTSYTHGGKMPCKLKSANQVFAHNLVRDFNCKAWTLDNYSLFDVPKDINFELMRPEGEMLGLDWLLL